MATFRPAAADKGVKVITLAILILLALIIISINLSEASPFNKSFISVILIGIVVIAYISKPSVFIIEDNKLIIKNLRREKSLMLRDIENVCRAETLPHFRTLGVGGLFGYYGLFNGNEKWWVTNQKKKVGIKLKNGKVFMISPEEPAQFIKELKSAVQSKLSVS